MSQQKVFQFLSCLQRKATGPSALTHAAAFFSSLRAKYGSAPILNLEQGRSVPGWGRMIFYVADVDAFWEYLRGKGFNPESPRDASWGERYFHMSDPDSRVVVCASDLAVFQELHELILVEEQLLPKAK